MLRRIWHVAFAFCVLSAASLAQSGTAEENVLTELKRIRIQSGALPKESVTQLVERYLTTKDRHQKLIYSLSLGVHYLNAQNPKLALQYLSPTEMAAPIQAGDPNTQLKTIFSYYRSKAKFDLGSFAAAGDDLQRLLSQKASAAWEKLAYGLLIESYYYSNQFEKLVVAYTEFSKRYQTTATQEHFVKLSATALEKKGISHQYIGTLEALAVHYPTTEAARWAFHRLEDIYCNQVKNKFFYKEAFLASLSRQASLDTGIHEFISSIIETPIQTLSGRVEVLGGKDKLEFLMRARFYQEAIDYASTELETAKGRQAAYRSELLSDLSKAFTYTGQPMLALRYLSQFIEEFPRDQDISRVRERLAEVYTRLQNPAAAAEQYGLLARRLGRKDMRWYHFWSLYMARRYEAALTLLDTRNYIVFRDNQGLPALKYWRAVINEKLGRRDMANAGFLDVLQHHGDSFYAFIATMRHPELERALVTASALSPTQPFQDPQNGTRTGTTLAAKIMSGPVDGKQVSPELQLVQELLQAGLAEPARIQLKGLTLRATDEEDEFGSVGRLGWLANDYQASRRIAMRPASVLHNKPTDWQGLIEHQRRFNDDWKVFYPLAYERIVQNLSSAAGVDSLLVLSVMRAESRYNADARSGAGARGLMQIMPATAVRVARLIHDPEFDLSELTRPDVNIGYGAYYLNKLLHYYGKNPFLAIAAYNAGPPAVNRWLEACGDCQIDEFVEGIPYWETRRYVKEVVRYYVDYMRIYKENKPFTALPATPRKVPEEEMF